MNGRGQDLINTSFEALAEVYLEYSLSLKITGNLDTIGWMRWSMGSIAGNSIAGQHSIYYLCQGFSTCTPKPVLTLLGVFGNLNKKRFYK